MLKRLVFCSILLSSICAIASVQAANNPIYVATVNDMTNLTTSSFPVGATTTVNVQGYYTAGSGAGTWVWNNAACAVAWCVAANTMYGTGSYTFGGAGPLIDPRSLGAYGDVTFINQVITVSASPTCTLTVSSGTPFASTDTGKNIVVTDQDTTGTANPTYVGTMTFVNTTTVSLAPCPTFNLTTSDPLQWVYWGHDDTALPLNALNTAIQER